MNRRLLVFSFLGVLALASCGKSTPASSSEESSSSSAESSISSSVSSSESSSSESSASYTYRVSVVSVAHLDLSGVTVVLTKGESRYSGVTNNLGMADIEAPEDEYAVTLENLPECHTFEGGTTALGKRVYEFVADIHMRTDWPTEDYVYQVGDIAYDFTYTDCKGREVTLSEVVSTHKITILNAFYVDCGYCQIEDVYFQNYYDRNSDDFALVGVDSYGDSNEYIKAFVEEEGLPFYMGIDTAGVSGMIGVYSEWAPGAWPYSVIIDRYGYIVACKGGAFMSQSSLDKVLDPLLADDYTPEF